MRYKLCLALLFCLVTVLSSQASASGVPTRQMNTYLVKASPEVESRFGITQYRVYKADSYTFRFDLLRSDRTGDGTLVLNLLQPVVEEDRHGGMQVTYTSPTGEISRLRLEVMGMYGAPAGVGVLTQLTIGNDSEEVKIDLDTVHHNNDASVGAQVEATRYSAAGSSFGIPLDQYFADPVTSNEQYQNWMEATGANSLFNTPGGLRIARLLADENIWRQTPVFSAFSAVGSQLDPDKVEDHGFWGTLTSCAAAAVCAETAWGGVVLCAACFAEAAACGWGLGEAVAN